MTVIRPRHASTLIILRREGQTTRVLMGERHGRHAFMPNVTVFPGGAVDLVDHRLPCSFCLPEDSVTRLLDRPRGCTPRGLALAAIRETFEETGLRIAHCTGRSLRSRNRDWAEFNEGGFEPAVDRLAFVARAITPPGPKRRYDTRFFATTIDAIAGDPDDFSRASGELGDLSWIDVDDVLSRDIRPVTQRGLRFALKWLNMPDPERPERPIPFTYMRHGKRVLDKV